MLWYVCVFLNSQRLTLSFRVGSVEARSLALQPLEPLHKGRDLRHSAGLGYDKVRWSGTQTEDLCEKKICRRVSSSAGAAAFTLKILAGLHADVKIQRQVLVSLGRMKRRRSCSRWKLNGRHRFNKLDLTFPSLLVVLCLPIWLGHPPEPFEKQSAFR